MNTRILKSIMLMAIMTLSLSAFAQEPDKGIGTPDIPTPSPSISVSIPKNGCACPSSGTVTSFWYWIKIGGTGLQTCGGTSFNYYSIPASGTTSSVATFSGYTPSTVAVIIEPNGGLGLASKTINYPNLCEIRPSACLLPGEDYYDCFDTD